MSLREKIRTSPVLVDLHPSAIELVFERHFAELFQRLLDALRRTASIGCTGRIDCTTKAWSAGPPPANAARATGPRLPPRRRAPECSGAYVRRARDGLDEHTLERALPQFAVQQPAKEVLLVARGAREQLAEQPRTFGVRAFALDGRE